MGHSRRIEQSSCSWERGRLVVRGVAVVTSLAMVVGCSVVPNQHTDANAPPATKPAAPPSQPPAQEVHQAGSSTNFHANASDHQRFQVRIDFGRIFEKQGDFEAALTEYQAALTVAQSRRGGHITPEDVALAERRIAVANDRLGRFALAETHYKKALKHAPKDFRVWNDLGYSYYVQARYGDAERALRAAARFNPDDERSRLNLGLTLAAAGRPQEALPLLSQAGGDAAGHANLGYLLASTGQPELAKLEYQKALAIRPDLAVARRGLAALSRPTSDRVAKQAGPDDPNLERTRLVVVEAPLPALPAIPPPRSWTTRVPDKLGAQP